MTPAIVQPEAGGSGLEAHALDVSPPKRPRTARHRAMLALKLLVTAAIVAWIVRKVDWPTFRDTLVQIPAWVLLVTVGVWFVCSFISALKWHQLLLVHDLRYRLRTLIR
jgi:hypothetical protein